MPHTVPTRKESCGNTSHNPIPWHWRAQHYASSAPQRSSGAPRCETRDENNHGPNKTNSARSTNFQSLQGTPTGYVTQHSTLQNAGAPLRAASEPTLIAVVLLGAHKGRIYTSESRQQLHCTAPTLRPPRFAPHPSAVSREPGRLQLQVLPRDNAEQRTAGCQNDTGEIEYMCTYRKAMDGILANLLGYSTDSLARCMTCQ